MFQGTVSFKIKLYKLLIVTEHLYVINASRSCVNITKDFKLQAPLFSIRQLSIVLYQIISTYMLSKFKIYRYKVYTYYIITVQRK